jgi:competence protein ComEC
MFILPFYTLLVGEPVPAVRSAVMTSVILLAVLTERRALSLRTVALAATLLLIVVPQTMLGASFQLSFAAVTVMIAGYETLRLYHKPALTKREPPKGLARLWQSVWSHGGGMALTSLLAGVATAPFTLFQFQQANWYGVFANMLGIPLTSFIIMPAGFIAYFLMPFGLELWPLKVMEWGIDGLMLLADYVGAWPGANVTVKAFPTSAFALMVLGGLWLCIWQNIWRLWGLVPIAAGLFLAMLASGPDMIIAPEFANWAVRQDATTWIAQHAREKDFTVKQWRQRAGNVTFLTQSEQEGNEVLRCDDLACLYHSKGMTVSIVRDAAALVEDCGVDLIITPLWHQTCAQGAKIDGERLKWQGATTITLHQGWWGQKNGAIEVRSVRSRWGARPWSPGWREDKQRPPSISQTISVPATPSIRGMANKAWRVISINSL